ncbi:response regulator [Paenibacillus sp. J2TS4]|uniref:response regulator transcription factor n=1 Tax=Paenibacillus sp. J2TS4 TaxID=2807194 RepID=UPI001B0246C4|nr:response regulator [Paenibacillus sp. J2TS4]GIP33550.1 hypothetical protein J2TS4_27600 [Paenibacillus sp. J2TS4]
MTKVLVVDDDYLVRKGFIAMMPWKRYGMEVAGEAESAKKALEFMADHPVDLLITDLHMPVMSGLELMREVRRLYPHIHMVVLTFHDKFDYIQEALRMGAIDYITKVELEDEKMDEVLRRIRERNGSGDVQPSFYGQLPSGEVSPSGEQLRTESLLHRWAEGKWTVDDEECTALIDETLQLQPSPARLQDGWQKGYEEWKTLLPPDSCPSPDADRMTTWDDGLAWIQALKTAVGNRITDIPYAPEMIHCIVKAQALIQGEFQSDLTLTDVAKRVGMSRSYFSRCFHDITGRTFNDYTREVRMKHSEKLLKQTNKPIHWVAMESGYPNEKYFSKVFRKWTGMLPSEFRKLYG